MNAKARTTFAVYAAALLLTVFLSACNTTRGFGQDIARVGDGLSGAAENTGATTDK